MTFHYQNFWFFWVYAGFVHFWHQHVDFFWVYAGMVNLKSFKPTYTQKTNMLIGKSPRTLIFFEYMQVWWTSSPSNLHILKKNKHFDREKLRTCMYSKKINILMPKAHKTCIYSKKSKVLIVKSHQTCIYSEKSKKSKTNSSMPVSPT